jgi:hypothetical protein
MSSDRDATRIVRSWLRTDENESADRVLDAVLDRLDTTPQRRATWWPTSRYNDMNPIQRLAVMAAAAVLVIALAYSLLVRPNVGQTEPTPSPTAAASDPELGNEPITSPPVEFTACVPQNSAIRDGTEEQIVLPHSDGDVSVDRLRGFTWQGTITATDPRLSGTHFYSWDADSYTLPGGGTGPMAFANGHRIENSEGAWQGSSVGFADVDGTSVGGVAVLIGEEAYEGLTAIIADDEEGTCFLSFKGFIMAVPTPPVPYSGD